MSAFRKELTKSHNVLKIEICKEGLNELKATQRAKEAQDETEGLEHKMMLDCIDQI